MTIQRTSFYSSIIFLSIICFILLYQLFATAPFLHIAQAYCSLNFGQTKFLGENNSYYYVSNKNICYAHVAFTFNDWKSCLQIHPSDGCLSQLSKKTNTFFCDKAQTQNEFITCTHTLQDDTNLIRRITGIEKYKIIGKKSFTSGDKFYTRDITTPQSAKGTYEIIPYTITINHTSVELHRRTAAYYNEQNQVAAYTKNDEVLFCKQENTPPVVIGSFLEGDPVLYVTGCDIQQNTTTLHFFTLNFGQ